ncbi:hypothetical protein N9M16_00975 [Candidatus Dependentiae bacterium]|nr:hypothetical protein [Candidatus Dependentiae bacterium]
MNSLAVPTLGNLGASGRIAPTQRVFKSRIVANSNSRRFDGAIPAVVSNYSRDDAIGVRLKREGKLRDKSMDANNEAAIAAAIATGIAVAIVAVEPAHAALASHLMPPTVYAPQFADLAVNTPAAVTTTQAGIDGTLDTTLISTSVFLLLATVLGSAGKKYSEKRARRAVWRGLASPHDDSGDSTSESVEHRRSNIVTKAGKKTGVNTKSLDATKIDAHGAKSLKSSRYNITPLKKGSVDSDRKAQKIQKAQKISFSGASNIINYKQKPQGPSKTAKRTITSSTKGTVFLTKSKPGDYGYKNSGSVTKKPYEDSVLAAAAAFLVGAVALTNVTATPVKSLKTPSMDKIGNVPIPAQLQGGIKELRTMEIPPEVINGVSKIGSGLTSGVETAADTFEAIPPEQSLATLGGVGILTLLALTSVAAAKRDKEYFEPKTFVFGDSLIADRAAIVARAEEAQRWMNEWYATDAGQKTFNKSKHASLSYQDPTMAMETFTITTGTGKKAVAKRPVAFRSERDSLLHDKYHNSLEIIDNLKLDKKILGTVRDFEANLTVIDIKQARRILKLVTDGPVRDVRRRSGKVVQSAVSNVELDTALYVLDEFKWSAEAKKWFFKELEQYF